MPVTVTKLLWHSVYFFLEMLNYFKIISSLNLCTPEEWSKCYWSCNGYHTMAYMHYKCTQLWICPLVCICWSTRSNISLVMRKWEEMWAITLGLAKFRVRLTKHSCANFQIRHYVTRDCDFYLIKELFWHNTATQWSSYSILFTTLVHTHSKYQHHVTLVYWHGNIHASTFKAMYTLQPR